MKSNPIKYHGGKQYLAKEIIRRFPEHLHYVEPYFGGGAVLLAKDAPDIEDHSELVNDINGDLSIFWSVMSSRILFEEFLQRCRLCGFSEATFDEASTTLGQIDPETFDPVERALLFFIKYRQSRQGLGKCFATFSKNRTRRGMNEQVSSWLSAIESLPAAHERLQRVVVLAGRDACDVIRSEDSENTFFYLDPPYVQDSRVSKEAYENEMTLADHDELLNALSNLKGKFLLSGYPSELYEDHSSRNCWYRMDITIDNKASSKKTKDKKTECLWSNYNQRSAMQVNDQRK